MDNLVDRFKQNWLQWLVHFLSWLPLALIALDYSQDRLTANPIQEITLRTGMYSLALLVLSLAGSPVARILKSEQIGRLRKPLGLYGFFYAALHFLNFIWVDYRLDFQLLLADVGGKAHIWVGLAALLALIPVAATSTRGWLARLGRNWVRLHWLVYPAAALSVLHFLLLVKADYREPVIYGLIVALLLLIRLRWVRSAAVNLRERLKKKQGRR